MQRTELGKSFTKDELEYAFGYYGQINGTGPGWDSIFGSQKLLGGCWTHSYQKANDLMETGNLPVCFQKVLITLIPKK
ncbi:hypothetical protein JCM33374_g2363 [Metschnikowia sp. JCM 33374]|nr:hypothetical protein JCM33374_g2363 [Metschnikowia sp. JCM 33374]